MSKKIGGRIKSQRESRGWSQEHLATVSGVSLRTIQRIENDKSYPRGETKMALASAFDMDVASLFEAQKSADYSTDFSDQITRNELIKIFSESIPQVRGGKPIFLCLDIPTGLYYPEQQKAIVKPHDFTPKQAKSVAEVTNAVLGVVGHWWLEEVVGAYPSDQAEKAEKAKEAVEYHLSPLTRAYFVARQDEKTKHSLHNQIIMLIVLHSCTRLSASSLAILEESVMTAHPHANKDTVIENLSIFATSEPSECLSLAATLAELINIGYPET